MTYKGYTGVCEVDEEFGDLYGRVVGLRDGIMFRGKTYEEAEKEFRASVDFYLEMCAKHGQPPEVPYFGKLVLRIAPDLHQRLADAARERGLRLDEVVELACWGFLSASAKSPVMRPAEANAAGHGKVTRGLAFTDDLEE